MSRICTRLGTSLPAERSRTLLAGLREGAPPSLVEMARWKHDEHAVMAYFLLGCMGGIADGELMMAWSRGEREATISKDLAAREDAAKRTSASTTGTTTLPKALSPILRQ